MHGFSLPRRHFLALLFVIALPTTSLAQTTTSHAQIAGNAVNLAAVQCPDGEERFLPGDYYFCIGTVYFGRGRYGPARETLELAARWGSKPAQYVLGLMNFNGDHTPTNRPLGIAWLALAAERPIPEYLAVLRSAWLKANGTERAQARKLLAQMRTTYADQVAAVRAKKRYDRAMHELSQNEVFGAHVCVSGFTTIEPMPRTSSDPAPRCFNINSVAIRLEKLASHYFEGWEGVVRVGPLTPVKPPVSDPAN